MKVLLELNGMRKILCVSRDELVFTIENEIRLVQLDRVLAYLSSPQRQSSGYKRVFILQRWSKKWNLFVDVTDVDQVDDGDRLLLQSDTSTQQHNNTTIIDVSSGQMFTTQACLDVGKPPHKKPPPKSTTYLRFEQEFNEIVTNEECACETTATSQMYQ